MTNTGKPGDENTDSETTHDEPAATADSSEDTSPRLSIPPNLWDTGLFKPAWARPSTGTPGAPPRSGSLLSRPEDLDPQPEPAPDPGPARRPGGIDPDLIVPPSLAAFATGTHPAVPPAPEAGEPAGPVEGDPAAEEEPAAADETADESAYESGADEPAVDPAEEETGEQTALALSPIEATEAAAAAAAAGAAAEAAAEAEAEAEAATEAAETDADPEPTQPVPRQPGPPDATQVAAPRVEEPTRVTPVAAPTAPPRSPSTAPTAVVPPLGEGPATATTVVPAEDDDAPRRRGKGLAVLLAIVVVAALIGGGWFLWQRNQDGPVREAFGESHGAFVSAATQLTTAESLADVAAASDDFAEATALLQQTRSTAGGRTSSLSASVRRAVAAQLEVSQAAEQLGGLGEQDYAAWGAVRGDLKSGLESLEGVHDDVVAAGGATDDLPSSDVVATTDEMLLDEARRSGQQRTRRATADLAAAELVKDLRAVGRRTSTGATQLGGAVDSLGGADVDTSGLEAHRAVQEALGRLTRLKPATLNEWEAIRTRADRAAGDLPDEAAAELRAALTSADTMVTAADEAWDTWLAESEEARTAKADDLEAVRTARTELDTLLQEFRTLDGDLAAYLSAGTAAEGGPDSEPRTTLVEAADARDGLRTRVSGLGIPAELAEETSALEAALSSHAATVRAAADAAATCVVVCRVPDTSAWQTLVAQREAQATAVGDAVQAWRDAAQDALKEIRQRELPEKPEI